MSLHPIDLAVLLLYVVVVTAIGIYFSRKNTSTEEYFVGGRSFSGWIIGLSLVGTSISSITFIAYPADAFKTAWLRYLPNLMLPLAIVVAAYVFLPFFRRKRITSAYEYLEDRFGPSIRVYGAIAFIVAQVVRVSMILYLLSLLVQELTGLDPIACILIGGIFVAAYTIIGGIDAVIWTDVMQTIILALGGLFCLVVITQQLPGGFSQILEVAQQHGKLAFSAEVDGSLTPVGWHFSLSEKTGLMMLFIGLTAWLTEYSSNQNTVQRYCASRSEAEARKGMFVCAAFSLPIWAFYMFLGTALFVFFQEFPAAEASAMLSGEQKAEHILPYFVLNHLPVGVTGIVIAAALAAAMSSLDSSLNAISTVSVVDIYRRHLKPDQSDRHYLKAAWVVATITAFLMIGGAIWLRAADTKTLQDTATILTSLLGGGLLGLYLMGFFTKQGNATAAWCGLLATMAFTFWTIASKNQWLPESMAYPLDLYYTGLIGNLIMFCFGYISSQLFSLRKENIEELTVYTKTSS